MTHSDRTASQGVALGDPDGQAQPDGRGRHVRLVVVDDDPRVRAAVAQTVSGEDDLSLVGQCADAPGAVSIAVSRTASVALVDLLLPDQQAGLDLVRAFVATSDCAVVAMSVRSGLRLDALAAGAVAFVEKGGDIEAILAAVRFAASISRG